MSGHSNDADNAIDRALKMRRDVPMLSTRATIAQQQGDFGLARNLLDEGKKVAPSNEQIFAMSVSLSRQTGEAQKGLVETNEFLKRNPTSEIATVLRVDTLLQLNRSAEAKQDIDSLLKKAPGSRIANYYDALLAFRTNDPKGAWQKAQRLTPAFVQSDPTIASTVAAIAMANGNRETAEAILASSISRYPDFGAGQISYGRRAAARKTARTSTQDTGATEEQQPAASADIAGPSISATPPVQRRNGSFRKGHELRAMAPIAS